MAYDIDDVKDVLYNLKEDPMRVILTEHFLDQVKKRDIPNTCLEDALENAELVEIRKFPNHKSRFEVMFSLPDSSQLSILLDRFNKDKVFLISAFFKGDADNPPSDVLEFEGVYDYAFDLADIHSRHFFGFAQTVEMETGFNIDFDSCGHPVAIEIIRPSRKFSLSRKAFSDAQFDGEIEIASEFVRISMKAYLNNDGGERIFEREVENDFKIPSGKFEFAVSSLKE